MRSNQSVKCELDTDCPSDGEVRACLHRLLDRAEFSASERNKRFLAYVVEETLGGRAGRLKAYNIAVAAFNRSEDFDPQVDPIVRIEAGRLRRSLEHYYLTAGASDRIRIDIPKGSYVATFAYRDPIDSRSGSVDRSPPMPEVVQPPMASKRTTWVPLASVLALLAMLGFAMVVYGPGNERPGEGPVANADAMSIVVLPFDNSSGDPSKAFAARGLTYDLMMQLTQLQGATVFSSNGGPGGALKGQTVMRPNYALIGSIQSQENKVRVVALLANVRTGQFLGSWSFERDLAQTSYPDFEADIAKQIVLAVRSSICAARSGDDGSRGAGSSSDCPDPLRVAAK